LRVRRIVTTRDGGSSKSPYDSFNLSDRVGDEPEAVAANRRRLSRDLGLADDRVVWMEQVHGRNVAVVRLAGESGRSDASGGDPPTGGSYTVVDAPAAEPVEATDALVTAVPGLALAVQVADCVPVLLADPDAGVVAAVHAGRVGARVGVVPAALAAMNAAGARTDRVEVLLGPSVCGACYEVPAAMQADVQAHLPGSACRTRSGTPGLDLRAGLWEQLAAAGVAKIGVDPRCTVEDRNLFSHRRDGTTGRIAAITWTEFEPGEGGQTGPEGAR
jgi:YfiH family protein